MSLTVADLLAKLSLDTSGFRKGAEEASAASKKVEESAGKAGQATEGAGQSATKGGKSFGDLSKSLNDTTQKFTELLTPANLFGTVIGVTVVGALKSAVASAFEFSSELRRLSLVTGDSLGRVAEFQGAVDKLGVGSDKLSRAFFFLSSEMENGGANLAKLGIELHTTEGYEKSVIDITEEVGDKFRAMGAGAEVAAAARKLLGRQAVDMLPVFQLEREQIKQLGEEEKRFADQIGIDGVIALTKFRGSLMEVGGAVTRVQTLLTLDLAGAFKSVTDTTSSAIDVLLLVPKPIRLAGEAAVAAGLALIALTIAAKTLGLALGLVNPWVLGIGVGLAVIVAIGPSVMAAIASLLPQVVINAWQSFSNAVGSAYQAMKNFIGLGPKEVLGPPESLAAKQKYEPTLADEQKRLQFTQQLTAANIALGQATMTSEAAQVNAIKQTLAQRLDELAVQARFDTTPTNLARTAELRAAAQKTADAQIAQIASQTKLQLLTIEEQTAEQRLVIEGKSREAALAVRIDEIEQAKKLVADEYAAFGVSQEGFVNETIRLNSLELTAKQAAITQEMGQVRAAQQLKALLLNQQVAAHQITQAKADEELVKLQVDTDAKLLDLTTKAAATKREITNQNRELKKKATLEELTFVAQAENRDLALKVANLDAYKRAHADNVLVVVAATAEEYRLLKSAYDKDVQNYIDAQLHETGILKDEVAKRVAQEAGLINTLKQLQQQYIDNQATVLEQQARQAGDLGAAYQVGFAQAASSADDAFAVMKKSGADAYASLKSGFSDFLYDTVTRAKSFGDAFVGLFVNVGKRIVRTMTDVFAEILAKQLAMSAGFSFAGLFGTAGAAVAGMEGAPNQAAQAVTQLKDSATGASQALSGMGQISTLLSASFGSLGSLLLSFGSVVLGVMKLLVSAGSLGALGGSASSSASNLLGNLGSLGSAFGNFASLLQGGMADMIQKGFDLFGGSGIFGGALGPAGGAGVAAQLLGKAIPIAGGLISIGLDFIHGNIAGGIGGALGGAVGAFFGGPVGFAIGAQLGSIVGNLFGSLFGGPTPEISGMAKLMPTDIKALLAATHAVPWSSGPGPNQVTNPPGRSQFSYLDTGPLHQEMYYHRTEGQLSREQSQIIIQNVILDTLQAAVKGVQAASASLPTQYGGLLKARLEEVLSKGLDLTSYDLEGDDAVQQFSDWLKKLSGQVLTTLTAQLFPSIDLAALGAGDAAKGFDNLIAAMSAMGGVVKAVGDRIDLSSVSLDDFASKSVEYFKQFAKEGEAFIDTVKRITTALSGIIDLQGQVAARQQALTGDVVSAITKQGEALMTMVGNIGSLADALHVAVASNASPEEVLKAAQTLLQAYDAAIQMAQQLKAMVDALNKSITDGVDLIVSLTTKIDTLRGGTADASFIQASIDGIVYLFNALTDVTSRISLFASGLALLAESTGGILANLPLVTAGFNTIMAQIQAMTNPAQAVAALKDLAGAVESGLQAGITAINRQTQERIAALNAEKAAIQQVDATRIAALNDQKAQLTKVYDAQKTALQASLALAQQWAGVLTSVKTQLTDLFNLLAPTHPLTSLNEIKAQFESAFAAFQSGPTPEGATHVQDLAKQLLDLAKQTPGYELPGSAFQGLAGEVQSALQAIGTFASSQPTQEQIQAQIAALDKQQADSLAAIDAQITALTADQSAQLAAIDQQIQQANLDGQAQIQQLQAVAASGLEAIRAQLVIEVTALADQQTKAAAALYAVLGDKTFEQFIAEKQAEAADLLKGIDNTLAYYLGSILHNLFPNAGMQANVDLPAGQSVPHLADGGIVLARPGGTLVRLGEGGYSEAVIPLRSGSTGTPGGQGATVNISFTYAGSARRDEWDRFLDTVIEDARFGKLGKVISEKAKGA